MLVVRPQRRRTFNGDSLNQEPPCPDPKLSPISYAARHPPRATHGNTCTR